MRDGVGERLKLAVGGLKFGGALADAFFEMGIEGPNLLSIAFDFQA